MPVSAGGGGSGDCDEISDAYNIIRSRGHTSNFVLLSAIILWKPIPTPSITASRHAHPIAELRAALYPPRTASDPPVKKPAMTE